MLITYLILFICAILFKLFHWPGVALILLFAPIFTIFDLVVQLIRKREDKETRIWSAVSMIFWSLYLAFKFLYWPGSGLVLILALLFTLIYFIRVMQKKNAYNYRFYVLLLVTAFGLYNASLKNSTFRMTYMFEDPLDATQPSPHFYRQRLAFDFYNEGNYKQAEELILMNIKHLEVLVGQDDQPDFIRQADKQNLLQSQADLEMIRKRNWEIFIPLFPEDRQE
jgi:signal transduction histidine kinase